MIDFLHRSPLLNGGFLGVDKVYPSPGIWLLDAIKQGAFADIKGTFLGFSRQTGNTLVDGTRSYTISGTFAATDTIVILTGNQSSTSNNNLIDSATINSVSATKAVTYQSVVNSRYSYGIFYVSGVSGSSLSIDVAYTGTDVFRSGCYAYKIDNADAVHVQTDASDDNEELNVSAGGDTFAVAIYGADVSSSPSASGTGWTVDSTDTVESFFSIGCLSKEDPGTSAITLANNAAGACAVFRGQS